MAHRESPIALHLRLNISQGVVERPAVGISGAGDNATDRVPALSAVADVNARRFFSGADFDFRRILARRRRVICRRVGVESRNSASFPPATAGANQIRARLEAEESIDAAIIRPSLILDTDYGPLAVVLIARVFQSQRDRDHRSPFCVSDSPGDHAALVQRDSY